MAAAPLSVAQIYNAARQAGFKPAAAVIATAVALAESGGRPDARCHNCFPGVTEDSRGLWQINVDAHPQYAGWNLTDPLANARAAYAVSSGGRNFSPWSTYTNGAYRSTLTNVYGGLGITAGAPPPDQVPGVTIPAGGGNVQDAGFLSGIANSLGWNLLGDLGSGITQDIARVTITALFVVGGVALVVVGFYRGVQPAVQRTKEQAAGAAATLGKVAAL